MKRLSMALALIALAALIAPQAAHAKSNASVSVEAFFRYDKALPFDAQEEVVEETDSYKKIHFTLRTSHERRIPGLLMLPKNGGGKSPVLFMQHGIHDHKETMLKYGAQYLIDAGIAVVGIDAEYHGERENDLSGKEFNYVYDLRDIWTQTAVDIQRTTDWMQSRDDIDPDRIAYWGHSMGSLIGMIAVAVDKRLKGAAFVGTGDFMTAWGQAFKYAPDFKYLAPIFDTEIYVKRIAPRPLLIVQGKADGAFSKQSTEKLFEYAGEPKRIEWVEGEHLPPAESVMPIVVEWAKETLGVEN